MRSSAMIYILSFAATVSFVHGVGWKTTAAAKIRYTNIAPAILSCCSTCGKNRWSM